MSSIKYTLLITSLLVLCGCQYFSVNADEMEGEEEISQSMTILRNGVSFGECVGYCRSELEINSDSLIYTRVGWNAEEFPPKVYKVAVSRETRNEMLALIDFHVFDQLEEVYGCPDCADGGAEWLEVERDTSIKRVTFDYGLGPDEIQPVLEQLRVFRNDAKEIVGN